MATAAAANASGPARSGSGDTDIQLSVHIGTRDGTLVKDGKLVNCAVEVAQQGGVAVVKRFGLDFFIDNPAGAVRGSGLFVSGGHLFGVYSNGTIDFIIEIATGVSRSNVSLPGLIFAGEQYQFINTSLYNTNPSVLKSCNGMWVGVNPPVKVTDADYPFTTFPGVAYLDGTYYVMATDGTVRGSQTALDNPTSWDALSFIRPDQVLGNGAGIVRHLNYIVAFYEFGTQIYYDAGNSPGIPLSPLPNASWTIGCLNGNVPNTGGSVTGTSVQEFEDVTYFLGQDSARTRTVNTLNGLTLNTISNPYIDRILQRSTLADIRSMAFRTGGHGYYCLTLPDIAVTLVYDIVFAEWYLWTSTDGSGAETFFQFISFSGSTNLNGVSPNGLFLQHISNGNVCQINQFSFQEEISDSTFTPISVRIVTPPYDWGTLNMKRFSAVNLHADTVASNVMIRYSDDDYNTFSAWRNLDLSTVRKQLVRMGGSRRRSYELLHTANTPFRAYVLQSEIVVSNM